MYWPGVSTAWFSKRMYCLMNVRLMSPVGPLRLLGDDHFDDALVLARFVQFGAVQHHDGVGVLFDGARFAQIGQARPMVLAVFRAAVDLGQGDDGNVQLAGQELEPA